MHVYKEFTQPTAVTHSVACRFTGGEEDLVVVKGNSLLQLYSIKDITIDTSETQSDSAEQRQDGVVDGANEDSFIGEDGLLQASKEQVQSKFVFVDEWPLDGFVTNIDRVKTLASDRDLLIITFKYAKAVLVEWDVEKYTISTISLHFYERGLFEQHFSDVDYPNQLTVDPRNSCFCLMYQRDQLALLPFLQKEAFEDVQMNNSNDTSNSNNAFYASSVILTASQFGEDIANMISIAFLHEYSEPTLAMIFQPHRTWTGTLPLQKDTVRYLVFALDLQRSSYTPIVSAQDLPYDTHTIVPLKEPIGGSLLIGMNQLLHIDSAGKVCGVAVNGYSKLCTKLPLSDQSDLELRLEGCKVVTLTNSELLLVTDSGATYSVNFKVEGKKVYKVSISLIQKDMAPAPSAVVAMKESRNVFVGSRTGEARLLSWKREGETAQNKLPVESSENNVENGGSFEDDEDEDLYGTGETNNIQASDSDAPIELIVDDALPNYGPITSVAIGKPSVRSSHLNFPHPSSEGYDIVGSSGSGITGSLSVFQKSIKPRIFNDLRLPGCLKLWTLGPESRLSGDESTDFGVPDTYLMTSNGKTSKLYEIGKRLVDVTKKKAAFASHVDTVDAGTACGGSVVVQVCKEKVLIYDAVFSKVQSIEFGSQCKSVSIDGSHILIVMENGQFSLFKASVDPQNGKAIAEMVYEQPERSVKCATITSTTVFSELGISKRGVKRKRSSDISQDEDEKSASVCILLTIDDIIEIFPVSEPSLKVSLDGLSGVPNILSNSATFQKENTQEKVEFDQIMMKRIGDEVVMEEYLFMITKTGELCMYKVAVKDENLTMLKLQGLEFFDLSKSRMIHLPDLSGMSCIFLAGDVPCLISKTRQGPPRIHQFTTEPIYGFASFNTENVYNGFVYANDSEIVRMGKLYRDIDYSQLLPVQQIPFNKSITSITYHEDGGVYLVGTQEQIPFDYVDEDSIPVPGRIEDLPKAISYKSSIKVVSPLNWTVIDEAGFEDNEVVMSVKSVRLTVSESTKRRKEFIALGTSVLRGEDLAAKGTFYVYEVVEVVPEPGRPETSRKFKEVAREGVKGAVTALCEVEGHLLVSQAQKVIVRNIQEDNSIIPVAFLDLSVYVSEAKSLKNLLILGDAMKSVWLVGFGQEPYRMNVVSKDLRDIEVTSSEFSVHDRSLYIVSADTERRLHLLQYEPEDPTSLSGQRLLIRSEFFTGRTINDMVMVPMKVNSSSLNKNGQYLMPLGVSDDGALIGLVPVSESSYRKLFVLQQQIIDKEEQNCCLNPRMHRSHGALQTSGRAILDYGLIKRFISLPIDKKVQYGRKLGKHGYIEGLKSIKEIGEAIEYF